MNCLMHSQGGVDELSDVCIRTGLMNYLLCFKGWLMNHLLCCKGGSKIYFLCCKGGVDDLFPIMQGWG